jgi:hypothetical protein
MSIEGEVGLSMKGWNSSHVVAHFDNFKWMELSLDRISQ